MADEVKNPADANKAAQTRNLAKLPHAAYVAERAALSADGTVNVKQALGKLVSVDIADIDLLLGFSNGDFAIITNGALDATDGKVHPAIFSDQRTTLSDLLQKVGIAFSAKPGSLRLVSERIDAAPPPEDEGGRTPLPVEDDFNLAPPAPMQKISAGSGPGPGKGKGDGVGDYTEPSSVVSAFTPEPPVYQRGSVTPTLESVMGTATGLPNIASALYTSSQFKVDPSGRADIPLGAYKVGETTEQLALRASPERQATVEQIHGTAGNDTIDFNTGFSSSVGQWAKNLHLTINNLTTVSSIQLEFPGALPAGFGITGHGAVRSSSSNTWTIPIPATEAAIKTMLTNGLDLNIVYDVADSGGPFDFKANFKVDGLYGKLAVSLGEVLDFTWRSAVGTDGFTVTNAAGKPMMVLPREGVGVEVRAGAGNDTVRAGAGPDLLYGEDGDDSLYGGSGNDTLLGGPGNDLLDGEAGIDTASYSDATTAVFANLSGVSRIFSSTTLDSNRATGWGDDTLASIENLIGSDNNDTLIGSSDNNRLEGGKGDDWIEGGDGTDTLLGGEGNDTLLGGAGPDSLDGGAGNDTASYDGASAAVAVSLTTGRGTAGDALSDTLTSIENLIGSSYNDTLTGNAVANKIEGGVGDDFLVGMGGGDTLDGGAGVDTVSYAWLIAGGGVNVDLSASGVNATLPDGPNDTLTNIENLIGSRNNDTLRGDISANRLEGGQGNDTLEGGGGADQLIGGEGRDTASYEHAGSAVGVSLTTGLVGFTASGEALGDTFDSIEDLIGSNHADQLIGNAEDNSIAGGVGNDTLEGMGGADTLDGGGGTNTASYEHADGGVLVSMADAANIINAAVRLNNTGHARGDHFINIQNLVGSVYNDTLIGDGAANHLDGGAGDDVLEGGAGADTLDGGLGNNTASYASASNAVRVSMKDGASADIGPVTSPRFDNTEDARGDYFINIHNLTGSAYNDTLIGDDTSTRTIGSRLDGSGGNDSITGYATRNGLAAVISDTLIGGAGDDRLAVILQKDIVLDALKDAPVSVEGGAGNDTLILDRPRTSGVDYFQIDMNQGTVVYDWTTAKTILKFDPNGIENIEVAGSSNLRIYVTQNAANNYIKGGASYDYVSYSTSADPVRLITNEATGSNPYQYIVTGAGTDTLEGIEYIWYGSRYADTMTGGSRGDYFHGHEGNDSILGGGGNDTLHGGYGNDTVYGGMGNDTISGGWGSDMLYGGADANDYTGNDTLAFQDFNPTTDPVFVNISKNSVTAIFGNNARLLDGETSYGSPTGHGTDRVYGFKNIIGSNAGDYLYGNEHANSIQGMSGDDTLVGGLGNDALDGGLGSDTASWVYMQAPSSVNYGVMVNLSSNPVSNLNFSGAGNLASNRAWAGSADVDTLSGIENITGSSYRDYLVGSSTGGSVIDGGGGKDTLIGGAGNDSFIVNTHNTPDSIDGGAGTDTITLKGLSGNYSLSTLQSDISTISSIETIDLRGDGQSTALSLGVVDILGIAGTNTITILADKQQGATAGDRLVLTGGATLDGGVSFDPTATQTYNINSGAATIIWQVA